MSKQELKEIVKECLVEILSEGIISSSNIRESSNDRISSSNKQSQLMSMLNKKRSQVKEDHPRSDNKIANKKMDDNLIQAAKMAAGKDNVMASILADTASTTFKQNSQHLVAGENIDLSESNSSLMSQPTHGNDSVSLAVANSTPEEIFGDDMMDRWASLAFNGK